MSRRAIVSILFASACTTASADCPPDHELDDIGVCRAACSDTSACGVTEICEAGRCMPGPTDIPTFANFRVDPLTIESGQAVTIEYTVLGADEVRLDPDDAILGSGEVVTGVAERFPSETTTYQLVATKNGEVYRSETRRVDVGVTQGAPEIKRFEARARPGASLTIPIGDSLLLEYEVGGATTVVIRGRIGPPLDPNAGSWLVAPKATTTFELVATNDLGSTTKRIDVRVDAPPRIEVFTIGDGFALEGSEDPIIASWRVTGSGPIDVQLTIDDAVEVGLPKENASRVLFMGPHRTHREARLKATSPLGVDEAIVNLVVLAPMPKSTGAKNPAPLDDVAYLTPLPAGELRSFSIDIDRSEGLFGAVFGAGPNCNGQIHVEVTDPNAVPVWDRVDGCSAVFFVEASAASGRFRVRVSNEGADINDDVIVYARTLAPSCGDGIVQTNRQETCDDGNVTADDGCDSTCRLEPHNTYTVSSGPSSVSPAGALQRVTFRPRTPGDDPNDDGAAIVPLPFSYTFFGNRYDAVTVDVDGFVSFLPPAPPQGIDTGDPRPPNAFIAAVGADLVLGGGSVSIATAADRVQIWYEGLSVDNSPGAVSAVITLFVTGSFRIDYQRTPRVPFIAGVENASGRGGGSICGGLCTPAAAAALEGTRYEFLP